MEISLDGFGALASLFQVFLYTANASLYVLIDGAPELSGQFFAA
jgi:hypothetical protein